MDQYKLEYQKGSGTFSVVFTAKSLKTGKSVAIKCMKKKFDSIQKVKKLKQIQALNILSSHENIIKMIEALYDQPTGKLALVFELMDMNMYECLKDKKNPLTHERIKHYMFQVLQAIDFMHRKGIFHRDIKPQNILVKGNIAKLADLGSCKGKHSSPPFTDYISTRWYRAPQCLLTDGFYNQKMDIWGYGCVLFELITKKPLFPGKDELDQIHRIHNILGTPKQQLLEKFRSQATHMDINFQPKKGISLQKLLPTTCPNNLKNLLVKLLAYNPQERISAEDALKHEYFADRIYQNESTTPTNKVSPTNKNNRDFRSTLFHSKQPYDREKHLEDENQPKIKKNFTKQKNHRSKNNLVKNQQHMLPKISGINLQGNTTTLMDNYKGTFYNKKNSNDSPFNINQINHIKRQA